MYGSKRVQKSTGEDVTSTIGKKAMEAQSAPKLYRDRPEIKKMRNRFYEARDEMVKNLPKDRAPKDPSDWVKRYSR